MVSKSHLTLLVLFGLAFALVACAPQQSMNQTNTTTPITPIVIPASNTTPMPTNVETVTPPKATENDFALTLTYTEGDLIKLQTSAVSPDKVPVTLEYPKPFTTGGVWQTKVGDAGDYPLTITARDSRGLTTTERILVRILLANRAPVLKGPDSITVKEGDTIKLSFTATDADNDQVILSYSGWMKTDTYTTTFNDAGTYNVTVTASDGKAITKKVVPITVQDVNRAPTITVARQNRVGTELQTFQMTGITTNDPDGDTVAVVYGKPLDKNGRWTPQYDDAGNYSVTVTATDGRGGSATEQVPIIILAANRPPKVTIPAADGILRFKEGDVIDLHKALAITDDTSTNIVVTYSGWMTRATYQTTYDDAGSYTVKVTAKDETGLTTTLTVPIIVEDVNRPPVFVRIA